MGGTVSRSPLGHRRLLSTALLLCAATILLIGLFSAFGSEKLGWDARFAYLPAARAILDGDSPYPGAGSVELEQEHAYVYPPQIAVVYTPLTLFPDDGAALLAVLASLAALMGAIAVLEVRDLRCYAAVLVSAPAWNALEMANLSGFLVLGTALVWRYREAFWQFGVALGVTVFAKLFLWPLLVWSAATRGFRPIVSGLIFGFGVTAFAWAAIGFTGLADYPQLLRKLAAIQSENSYSLIGFAAALGLNPILGRVVMALIGGALLVATVRLGRNADELRAFTCSLAAALVLTPVLWLHYLALLFVPLAIARPRFSPVWLLPVVLWASPRAGNGHGVETLLPLLIAAIVSTHVLWPVRDHSTAPVESPT